MFELQDLKDFSISTWYEHFQHLSIKTFLIEVPPNLLEKLQSDDDDFEPQEICPEFCIGVQNILNKLDNNAFLKSNWHAPMDAKMFSFGYTLKINNINDIILFCSVSNILKEDFSNAKGIPFYLALKPWISIHPAAEFRCIVINKVLRGITPRDWPTYYPHFKQDGSQIIEKISDFYQDSIKEHFPRKHYTFDVILSYPDEAVVLDFGPLNSKTNLYAFSWKEILPLLNKDTPDTVAPVFRYLESDIGIMSKEDAVRRISNYQE